MNGAFPRLAATERPSRGRVGPVVVFLHGLGCERTQFALQLAGLNPRLRLLSLDLPGHGESPPFHARRYGVAPVAEAVCADLTERGHEDIVLVGHNAGGLVALQIAVTRAKLVRGVVLLDTTIALTEAELRANLTRSVESNNGEWRHYFMASMAEAWGDDDAARASVFRALGRTPDHVIRPFWHDILAFKSKDLWRRVSVPALYVRSKRETDLPLLRTLNPLISTTDLRPCCRGHWPHLQCPIIVNDVLHTFFAQLGIIDGRARRAHGGDVGTN